MTAGYTGPACQDKQHASCPGFWPAKFGARGRGTACACSCHDNAGRCLWPACSRPLPCPVHDRTGGMSTSFEALPADYRYQGAGARTGPAPARSAAPAPTYGPADDEEYYDEAPVDGYDDLPVKAILELVAELDLDGLEAVGDWEAGGKNRTSIMRAVEQRLAALEAEDGGGDVAGVEGAEDDGGLFEDYHRMSVFEIMSMIGELDPDELMTVVELEERGRNRYGILSRVDARLDELEAAGQVAGTAAAPEPELAPEPGPEPEQPEELDEEEQEDDEEEGAAFPIEDYDRLRVKAIVVLLAELEYDDLQLVRQREEAGKGRPTVLRAVDANLAQFDLVEVEDEDDELDDDEDEVADDVGAVAAEPLADYDQLTVFQVLRLLGDLDDAQLEAVAEWEEAGRNRTAILDKVDDLLGGD